MTDSEIIIDDIGKHNLKAYIYIIEWLERADRQ